MRQLDIIPSILGLAEKNSIPANPFGLLGYSERDSRRHPQTDAKTDLVEGVLAGALGRARAGGGWWGCCLLLASSCCINHVQELKARAGTGGRSIAAAARSVLSDLADSAFVAAFEIKQDRLESVYGADALAGAAYYNGERKKGQAHFFQAFLPNGLAPIKTLRYEAARRGTAQWMSSPSSMRANPKAQEYHTASQLLFESAMRPARPRTLCATSELFRLL